MNPLYSSMNTTNATSGIAELKQLFQASKNPVALFAQLSQNKPELQPLVQMLNNGMSPKEIVKSECQRRGIDFQQFMNSLSK